MPFADVGGNRLHYEDTGGEGSALVLLHPCFLDHTVWRHQLARFGGEHRVIAWDMPGHGMSEGHRDFTFWDAADDVVGLLDVIGVEQAVFAGMAEGASVALRAALAHRERARGLVLIGAPPHLGEGPRHFLNLLAQGWLSAGPVGELADAVLGILFANTDYDARYFIGRWQSRPPSGWARVWRAILDGQPEDLLERLPGIDCPVQFVQGAGDAELPLAVAHAMSARIARSRGVTEVPGGRYVLGLTHPEIVNAAIAEFMSDLGVASDGPPIPRGRAESYR